MEKDLGQAFNELKDDVSTYVEIKFNLYKLSLYEKAGKLVSSLSYILALAVLAFMAIFFFFLALGFLLGEWLKSTGAGMAIAGGIYLILIGILIMNKNRFSGKIMNSVISALDDNDDYKDNPN
jgi:cytochrome c biogenesis protein CcdA